MEQKVSIIILNWNGWKDTLECLESVYQINYPKFNIIIVDNGSDDESIDMIKKYAAGDLEIKSNFFDSNMNNKPLRIFEYANIEFKSLHGEDKKINRLKSNKNLILIKNDCNYGFSEGNNIGIKFSLEILDPDYILLLNNDTVVDKNSLNELVSFADNNKNVGIVGPKVCYYVNPNKIAYIGHNVNLCSGRILDPEVKNPSSPIKIDYVVGCGLLIKTDVIKDIGMLDPNYFLYYEDVDLCLRARSSGYGVFYVPSSKIWHKISLKEDRSLNSYYYGNRNSFLLIKKNRKSFNIFICYTRLIINKSILILYLIIKGNLKESFVVIKAVYDGLKGNYGYKRLD
jgi:GT2 family glycosyltransferase